MTYHNLGICNIGGGGGGLNTGGGHWARGGRAGLHPPDAIERREITASQKAGGGLQGLEDTNENKEILRSLCCG